MTSPGPAAPASSPPRPCPARSPAPNPDRRTAPADRGIARILKPGAHLLLSVFSTKFRHHPEERRTRNWLVHRNHYDHFFTRSEIRDAFAPAFELRGVLEELDGLNGFLHALLRRKG